MKPSHNFFTQSAETLAPALLGKVICRRTNGEVLRAVITETECYMGTGDTASHAHRGKTPRNSIMFTNGGHLYIYLCYGIHYLLNIVSGTHDDPQAVLIRGIKTDQPPQNLNGPGKVTKYLQIGKAQNGINLTDSDEIWIEDIGLTPQYTTKPRIGIDYALPADRARPWRFCIR